MWSWLKSCAELPERELRPNNIRARLQQQGSWLDFCHQHLPKVDEGLGSQPSYFMLARSEDPLVCRPHVRRGPFIRQQQQRPLQSNTTGRSTCRAFYEHRPGIITSSDPLNSAELEAERRQRTWQSQQEAAQEMIERRRRLDEVRSVQHLDYEAKEREAQLFNARRHQPPADPLSLQSLGGRGSTHSQHSDDSSPQAAHSTEIHRQSLPQAPLRSSVGADAPDQEALTPVLAQRQQPAHSEAVLMPKSSAPNALPPRSVVTRRTVSGHGPSSERSADRKGEAPAEVQQPLDQSTSKELPASPGRIVQLELAARSTSAALTRPTSQADRDSLVQRKSSSDLQSLPRRTTASGDVTSSPLRGLSQVGRPSALKRQRPPLLPAQSEETSATPRRKISMRRQQSELPNVAQAETQLIAPKTMSVSSPPAVNTQAVSGGRIEELYKSDPKVETLKRLNSSRSFQSLEWGYSGSAPLVRSGSFRSLSGAGSLSQLLGGSSSIGSNLPFPGTSSAGSNPIHSDRAPWTPQYSRAVTQRFYRVVNDLRLRSRVIPAQEVEFVNRKTATQTSRLPSGFFAITAQGRSAFVMRCPHEEHALQAGTYGVVYEGLYSGRRVAIKVPTRKNGDFEDISLNTLLHETEVMSEIPQHQHLVSLLGVCVSTEPGREELWMVLSFADGPDLASVLANPPAVVRKTLTDSVIVSVVFKISAALAFLHQQMPTSLLGSVKPCVIHRDVKLENILLSSDGPMLCDFGNAAASHQPGQFPPVQAITWYYAPPELYRALPLTAGPNRSVIPFLGGPCWDAWAFGCSLIELLGYAHPFNYLVDDPLSEEEVRRRFDRAVIEAQFVPRLSKRIEQPLLNLIVGLLHPQPPKRLTMSKFSHEIQTHRAKYVDAIVRSIAWQSPITR